MANPKAVSNKIIMSFSCASKLRVVYAGIYFPCSPPFVKKKDGQSVEKMATFIPELTSSGKVRILYHMKSLIKMLSVVFVIVALVAPIATTMPCADADCVASTGDCSCVCHSVPSLIFHETSWITSQRSEGLWSFNSSCSGAVLATDIFHPPISI